MRLKGLDDVNHPFSLDKEAVNLKPEDCIKFSLTNTYIDDEIPTPDNERTFMHVFTCYTYSGSRVCDIHVRERKAIDIFGRVTKPLVAYAVSATFYSLYNIDFFDCADVILSNFKKQYPETNMCIVEDNLNRIRKEMECANETTK